MRWWQRVLALVLVLAVVVPAATVASAAPAAPAAPATAAASAAPAAAGVTVAVPGPAVVLRAGPAVAAPRRVLPLVATGTRAAARFSLTFGSSVPTSVRSAVQAAANLWAPLLSSAVPITATVAWSPLGSGMLGWGGTPTMSRDFSGAPRASTFYPAALANALHGSDLQPSQPDVQLTLNSSFGAWYTGTAGTPPAGTFDMVSVAMHEIGHGLGFLSSMRVSGGVGSHGFGLGSPTAYDRTLVNGAGQNLVATFANGSTALGSQLTSSNVFQGGDAAVTAAKGVRPRVWAPSSWSGSSIAHLSEGTYPAGHPSALMTPVISGGEVVHSPGNIALGILRDSGWTVNVPLGVGAVVTGGRATEGHTGTRTMPFTIRLSLAPAGPVSVRWATADGTAAAGADYSPASGTVTFAAGQTSRTVDVTVVGDRLDEADETFTVRLSDPVHLRIADGTAVATIADDDP